MSPDVGVPERYPDWVVARCGAGPRLAGRCALLPEAGAADLVWSRHVEYPRSLPSYLFHCGSCGLPAGQPSRGCLVVTHHSIRRGPLAPLHGLPGLCSAPSPRTWTQRRPPPSSAQFLTYPRSRPRREETGISLGHGGLCLSPGICPRGRVRPTRPLSRGYALPFVDVDLRGCGERCPDRCDAPGHSRLSPDRGSVTEAPGVYSQGHGGLFVLMAILYLLRAL